MNKWIIGTIVAVVLVVCAGRYNSLVNMDQNIDQTYSQVQILMQSQSDKIPALVQVVKGYASHEKETFDSIATARAQLTAVAKIDPRELANNAELQKKVIEAQAQMNQAMVKLNMVRENYPQLQAAPMFNNLMAEIAGMQNRIVVARRDNQLAVMRYNKTVKSFPSVLYASAIGFGPKPYFQAETNAQSMPQINFGK